MTEEIRRWKKINQTPTAKHYGLHISVASTSHAPNDKINGRKTTTAKLIRQAIKINAGKWLKSINNDMTNLVL